MERSYHHKIMFIYKKACVLEDAYICVLVVAGERGERQHTCKMKLKKVVGARVHIKHDTESGLFPTSNTKVSYSKF